jgi:hypothetical protein
VLGSDNGGDFVGEGFQDAIRQFNIQFWHTESRTLEENRKIESVWRTLDKAGTRGHEPDKIQRIIGFYSHWFNPADASNKAAERMTLVACARRRARSRRNEEPHLAPEKNKTSTVLFAKLMGIHILELANASVKTAMGKGIA